MGLILVLFLHCRWLNNIAMKFFILLIFGFTLHSSVFSQSNGPRALTPAALTQIKSDVEKEAQVFRKTIGAQDLSAMEVNFAVDTFRIERIASMRMNVDYSTAGMNQTVIEKAASYDRLLNKYYNLLMGALKPADKAVLISTQRAWISFRSAEKKLITTMAKTAYSGGGSIQSNIVNGRYAELVVNRTLKIFNYYKDLVREN
jgi:uncharacterized protein YecT (DUF1311 family)